MGVWKYLNSHLTVVDALSTVKCCVMFLIKIKAFWEWVWVCFMPFHLSLALISSIVVSMFTAFLCAVSNSNDTQNVVVHQRKRERELENIKTKIHWLSNTIIASFFSKRKWNTCIFLCWVSLERKIRIHLPLLLVLLLLCGAKSSGNIFYGYLQFHIVVGNFYLQNLNFHFWLFFFYSFFLLFFVPLYALQSIYQRGDVSKWNGCDCVRWKSLRSIRVKRCQIPVG